MDLRNFPRVCHLLATAEALERSGNTAARERVLLDLGRYVQWLMRQDPASWNRILAEGYVQRSPGRSPTLVDPMTDEVALGEPVESSLLPDRWLSSAAQ